MVLCATPRRHFSTEKWTAPCCTPATSHPFATLLFSTRAPTFHPNLPISVFIQSHHHSLGLRRCQLSHPRGEILKEPSDGKTENRDKFKLTTKVHTHTLTHTLSILEFLLLDVATLVLVQDCKHLFTNILGRTIQPDLCNERFKVKGARSCRDSERKRICA